MMYRYYSTQRPVAPGTFPAKPGCEVTNYDDRMHIDGLGFMAWGHIDYVNPLPETEATAYELRPAPTEERKCGERQ